MASRGEACEVVDVNMKLAKRNTLAAHEAILSAQLSRE